ncbi:solute carrier family 22 member 1 isoform X2 [Drosophila kikkawai]|uniref:Solute carrier family 22 member 1 isoform X2 n=1 Tax=Drosophila kikkawai TaxID=30033 RepID=A0ABM4GGK5_DROKI
MAFISSYFLSELKLTINMAKDERSDKDDNSVDNSRKLLFETNKVDTSIQVGSSLENARERRTNSSLYNLRRSHLSFTRGSWEASEYIDFDDLLPMLGQFGWFQKRLFLFMIPFCYITAFVYLGQIFMTLTPNDFHCFEPELELMTDKELRKQLSIPREKDGSYSQCRMYETNYSRIRYARNKTAMIDTSLPTMPCQHGYVFNTSEMPFVTATMEFGWVCKDDKYATYAQIIFFVGSIVGCLGYGYFADHCGRVAALVSSCSLAIIGSIGTALSQNFLAFAVFRFFVGASCDTCFTMVYILVLEYIGPKYRTLVANLSLLLFYSPFTMLMPWIALASRNWRTFSIMAGLPLCFAMLSYWVLPESARWLVSVGEIDKAMEILEELIQVNKKHLPPWILELFERCCLQFYKEEMHGQLPGNIVVILTLDRFGRRWCSFAFTMLSGLFSLVGACIVNATHMKNLALAGRLFANMCYNVGLQWAAEMLPTVVRAQGVSFIHTMGFVAMMMSPPVVYLSQLSFSLMLIVLGVLGILAGVLALFLPETLNHELPQTLSEGNVFGKNQRMWHAPCCGPGARRSARRNYLHQGSSLRTLSRDEFRSKRMLRRTSPPLISENTSMLTTRSVDEKEIRTYDYK